MMGRRRHSHPPDSGAGALPSSARLGPSEVAAVLSRALDAGALGAEDAAVVFYDLSRLEARLARLAAAFPATALHAVAVKANPLVEVLRRICRAGHGAEVASAGELRLAQAAGFPIETIVFDSPVKTRSELEHALQLGVGINANSLGELERIRSLRVSNGSRSLVGIRVNPETGGGSIEATSVAVRRSKFGVPLVSCRTVLSRLLAEYDWLTGVHVHIGSQGMSQQQLIDGIGAVYDFFVETRRAAELRVFNLGGGLPAQYRATEEPIQIDEYSRALRQRCPELFGSEVRLVTELGRWLHASCGWVAARVEYIVDHGDGAPTLLVHVGADMFVRKAYRPADWHHDVSVCDARGRPRTGQCRKYDVAGPLCFAGDYIDRGVLLPEDVREGDYLVVHDAGAYTFSMWSLYNSRQFPRVIGYEAEGERFHCLRTRQADQEIVRFWSSGPEA